MRIDSSPTPPTAPTTAPEGPPTLPTSTDDLARHLSLDRVEHDAPLAHGVWTAAPAAAGHAGLAPTSTLRALAHAIAEDGIDGFDAYLEAHPDEARALAVCDRASCETALAALVAEAEGGGIAATADGYIQAYRALDRFESTLEATVRETVRSTAVLAIDEQLAALEGASPEALVDALRGAPPGSRLAEMAAALGMRGDEDDVHRVRRNAEHAREGLRELRTVLAGQTWSPEELPATARRVMDAMGLGDAPPGSMAASAFHRPALEAAEVAHYAELGAEVVHATVESVEAAVELPHALGHLGALAAEAGLGTAAADGALAATGAGLPILLTLVAIRTGLAIHHVIEENRHERTELARALGL